MKSMRRSMTRYFQKKSDAQQEQIDGIRTRPAQAKCCCSATCAFITAEKIKMCLSFGLSCGKEEVFAHLIPGSNLSGAVNITLVQAN